MIESIYKAAAHTKEDVEVCSWIEDFMPYVSRTEERNGVDVPVRKKNLEGVEDGNAIVIGDTTSTVSYQPNKFICGDHMVIIRANWLNVYSGLFITTLLRRERYRYNYGRAFLMESIQNTILKLPSDPDGNPDWKYMEQLIKSLPYSDKIPL